MIQALHRRRLITAALAAAASLASLPARASEGEAKKAGDPSVQLGAVAIPVTVNGRLANYLFLSIRINLNMAANEAKLRQQEPYFRDALVRTASKISFGQPGKDYLLDEPRFKQVMMGEWAKIAGPNAIKSIDVLTQSPKRHPY
ncbi:MAG: hypothetical protein QM647_16790 [Asticcacaulis sp.]|uniref:hypothetical protein n=1 Tax=Asticcacaulis sp. TaxID=1872648 RepID=UPI0039E2EABF